MSKYASKSIKMPRTSLPTIKEEEKEEEEEEDDEKEEEPYYKEGSLFYILFGVHKVSELSQKQRDAIDALNKKSAQKKEREKRKIANAAAAAASVASYANTNANANTTAKKTGGKKYFLRKRGTRTHRKRTYKKKYI